MLGENKIQKWPKLTFQQMFRMFQKLSDNFTDEYKR